MTLLLIIFAYAIAYQAHAAKADTELTRRMIERRAVEAVVWGMPVVNYERMLQAAEKIGAGPNQIAYWSRPFDWHNQTLTPNPDTIYLMPFMDTSKVGPVVLEIPPAEGGVIVGSVDDAWQMPLVDVGPAGEDKGKGGKYLILPPGYKGKIPAGYLAVVSPTFKSYALLRSNVKDRTDASISKAVEYARRIKLYPLSQAKAPPKTKFVNAIDVLFDTTIPYDVRFFDSLNRMVQSEPWLTRDKVMIDQLRYIGIEKGKPFAPDEATKKILNAAAHEARAWMEAEYEAGFSNTFNKGTNWALPVFPKFIPDAQAGYSSPDAYAVDARGISYMFVFFAPKNLCESQFYFFAIKDNDGNNLDGTRTYHLRVPANAPVRQYWSIVAYDRETHALIRDVDWASRASNMQHVQRNADGSVDIWFGPRAPEGKESNWIPTKPGRQWEALFRFYGPEPALFEKTWVLPNIEKVR